MRRRSVPVALLSALTICCAIAAADAATSGQATGGTIPALAADGVPVETTRLLLDALDPGVRIVGEAQTEDQLGTAVHLWVIVRGANRLPEQHPDRIVVNVEAPAGSKAFSLVVAALARLGFSVTGLASVPLQGKPFGFRYLLVLAADKPILVLRLTDAIARDSRLGGGRAVLIGAWKEP